MFSDQVTVTSVLEFTVGTTLTGAAGRRAANSGRGQARRRRWLRREKCGGSLGLPHKPHLSGLWVDLAEFVGQTPWPARVPLDPLACRRIKSFDHCESPTGASAAVQGTAPPKEY